MKKWRYAPDYEAMPEESRRVSLDLPDAVAVYFDDSSAVPVRVNGHTYDSLFGVLKSIAALDSETRLSALNLVRSQISEADCMRHYNIGENWPAWALEVARSADRS